MILWFQKLLIINIKSDLFNSSRGKNPLYYFCQQVSLTIEAWICCCSLTVHCMKWKWWNFFFMEAARKKESTYLSTVKILSLHIFYRIRDSFKKKNLVTFSNVGVFSTIVFFRYLSGMKLKIAIGQWHKGELRGSVRNSKQKASWRAPQKTRQRKTTQRAGTSEGPLKIADTQCKNELQSIARRTL